jgi:hypothetical protein
MIANEETHRIWVIPDDWNTSREDLLYYCAEFNKLLTSYRSAHGNLFPPLSEVLRWEIPAKTASTPAVG